MTVKHQVLQVLDARFLGWKVSGTDVNMTFCDGVRYDVVCIRKTVYSPLWCTSEMYSQLILFCVSPFHISQGLKYTLVFVIRCGSMYYTVCVAAITFIKVHCQYTVRKIPLKMVFLAIDKPGQMWKCFLLRFVSDLLAVEWAWVWVGGIRWLWNDVRSG